MRTVAPPHRDAQVVHQVGADGAEVVHRQAELGGDEAREAAPVVDAPALTEGVADEGERRGGVRAGRIAEAAAVQAQGDVELAEQARDLAIEVGDAGEDAGVGDGHEPLRHEPAPVRHGDAEGGLEE